MNIGNLEVYGIIYKITNKINNKVYIGQTIIGFDRRYDNTDWWEKTHNAHLKSSVQKYGINNFIIDKIYDIAFSKTELDIKEKSYIILFKSNDRLFGYNKKDGGANGKHSKESKIKMSIAHSGVKPSFESRLKMSIARKGKQTGNKNPMYGKNPLALMTKEAYNELMIVKSENMKGDKNPMYRAYGDKNPFYGKTHSEETKRILSEKTKKRLANNNPLKGRKNEKFRNGNSPSSKNNVEVYDKNMTLLHIFESVKECCEWMVENNIIPSINGAKDAINTAIRKNKFYKDYYFKKVLKEKYKEIS